MTVPTRRVIKVGGSLLDWPPLGPQLQAWLAQYAADDNLLIAGGGPAADWLRQAQQLHHLTDHAIHWLAIRAMQLTAALVAELVPQATVCGQPAELLAPAPGGRIVIVDAFDWLSRAQAEVAGTSAADDLPATWDVTSDSIAAHLAALTEADELVLLKSALPPARTLRAAAHAGYLDRWLQNRWSRPVRCVNLRAEGWPEAELEANDEV